MPESWNEIKLNKRRKACMVLVLIPIIVAVIAACIFLGAVLLEKPTGRGPLYTMLIFASILLPYLMPIPCLCLSIIGMANSSVLRRYNMSTTSITVLGTIGLVIEVLAIVFDILLFAGLLLA